ncbi:hypothetical protein DAEQUDRAFT_121158 [Daedalea quercina L-15889]|uniref:Uncharacterized protein n=1 Tax=Daedalea quercina L-15889 TaxID=1314783 RepID=A0A165RWJ1_9APHY|nr:hypothetical protein DAEQUDRAFT_121158 [Daedalea quercina L-15889]
MSYEAQHVSAFSFKFDDSDDNVLTLCGMEHSGHIFSSTNHPPYSTTHETVRHRPPLQNAELTYATALRRQRAGYYGTNKTQGHKGRASHAQRTQDVAGRPRREYAVG